MAVSKGMDWKKDTADDEQSQMREVPERRSTLEQTNGLTKIDEQASPFEACSAVTMRMSNAT